MVRYEHRGTIMRKPVARVVLVLTVWFVIVLFPSDCGGRKCIMPVLISY
jgi:hypothetical protein